jgi:hypothetical protein
METPENKPLKEIYNNCDSCEIRRVKQPFKTCFECRQMRNICGIKECNNKVKNPYIFCYDCLGKQKKDKVKCETEDCENMVSPKYRYCNEHRQ